MEYSFNGRYSEILKELLDELGAEKELCISYEDNYQGYVDVDILLKDGRVFSFYYDYGSCSGCDEWENRLLDDEEIKEEMKQQALFFKNKYFYDDFIKHRQLKI